MIILFVSLLFVLAVIYAVFFCIFKLIWVILKKERNFWPLVLAGVFTFLLGIGVVCGTYVVAKKVMAPFQQLINNIQSNPDMVIGQSTYKDPVYPFEMTVIDGMDYSDWFDLSNVSLKGGIDTNVFKKGYDKNKPFLMSILMRNQEDEKDPLKSFKESARDEKKGDNRIKVTREGETTINGLPAYEIEGVLDSNRGPVDFKVGAILAPDKHSYVIIVFSLGENTLGTQADTMIKSFRFLGEGQLLPAPTEQEEA